MPRVEGVPDILPDRDAIRRWLVTTWEGMAARRYGGATTTSRTVTVLAPRTVLLRARGTRHDVSDAPLEDVDVRYVLVRTGCDDPWRIAVVTPVDPTGIT
ncbi:hypothetical protein PSU4_12330 [Pseudonocardia sulfidoxydans NBRC 16205]|uniref:Uncharacterized protein n=1 Tax=Pseudonocardia sulfidoxydans NBRC 16205 TaxID=1223511 RepID=A0A511DBU7_9PSEU|nr:hypothetical protein [Pseudonocardia sulfidoxydans]GEL22279.1 hypothetical protein PSU4_12330 [Pseudonocardia sulfidoxydans NBRC 16205]